jgi:hypothetical protein
LPWCGDLVGARGSEGAEACPERGLREEVSVEHAVPAFHDDARRHDDGPHRSSFVGLECLPWCELLFELGGLGGLGDDDVVIIQRGRDLSLDVGVDASHRGSISEGGHGEVVCRRWSRSGEQGGGEEGSSESLMEDGADAYDARIDLWPEYIPHSSCLECLVAMVYE